MANQHIKLGKQTYKNSLRIILENTKQELDKIDKDIEISETDIPFRLLMIPGSNMKQIPIGTHWDQMGMQLDMVAQIGEEMRREFLPWATYLKTELKTPQKDEALIAGIAKHRIKVLRQAVMEYRCVALNQDGEATSPEPDASEPTATTLPAL